MRHVDVIRSNLYVFLFRTPQYSLQKRLQLDTLRTDNTDHVNIVIFMKHVYVQYAAEPNLHTYTYEMPFWGFEVVSALLLQSKSSRMRRRAICVVTLHCLSLALPNYENKDSAR